MSKIDLTIPALGKKFVDLRDTILGDSYNWSWIRPLSQVNYLAIHHSATSDAKTPQEIASFHITDNGWGGIGYHFLIGKDGKVFYVGDISTARANVANLNEQVIGICLIGNFTDKEPTVEQLAATKKLCDFFITDFADLTNVKSYDAIAGHKELPGQTTDCPGNSWPVWKAKILGDVSSSGGGQSGDSDRSLQIRETYKKILGREPDSESLQTYLSSSLTLDDVTRTLIQSEEHQNIINSAKQAKALILEVENLQASLGLVNGNLVNLQQNLTEKEEQISTLMSQTAGKNDQTLTIIEALLNLYKFIFLPGKVA